MVPHRILPTRLQIELHTPWVRRLARAVVGDGHAAEDVVQDAWVKLAGEPPERALAAGYLQALVHALAHRRRRGDDRRTLREERAARAEALPSTAEVAARVEVARRLAEALQQLDEPYRTTLVLRYFEDLSAAEIARRAGIPAGTVRARLKRGLDLLRARLDDGDGGRVNWIGALAGLMGADPRASSVRTMASAMATTATLLTMKLTIALSLCVLVALLAWTFVGRYGAGERALDPRPVALDPGKALGDGIPPRMSAGNTGPLPSREEVASTDAPTGIAGDIAASGMGAMAAGTVSAALDIDFQGARVEVMDIPNLEDLGLADAQQVWRIPFAARGNAAVRGDRSFTVPAPSRQTQPLLRLRIVLADGYVCDQGWTSPAFNHDIELRIDGAVRNATGRLLFRGTSAAGLATVHAARGGEVVGRCDLAADGHFSLSALPCDPFDVVVTSTRLPGVLVRYQLTSLTGERDALQLDLGALELEGLASVLELELVDPSGAPASARLQWRGRGGSGRAVLRAAPVHTFLMPAVVDYDLEIERSPRGTPVPLTAYRGRARIVLEALP